MQESFEVYINKKMEELLLEEENKAMQKIDEVKCVNELKLSS